MTISEFKSALNRWGQEGCPFFFMVDFEMERPVAWRLSDIDPDELRFEFGGHSSRDDNDVADVQLETQPPAFDDYRLRFDIVMRHLRYGDSFLTNLTIKTPVDADQTLQQLYKGCVAKYKVWWKGKFLVFSPETFVQIRNGMISSFPMKGTIPANIHGAQELIISDEKEKAEHVTIVDLLRNDISVVAEAVTVKRFRYIERIVTGEADLYQVSSEVSGRLLPGLEGRFGDIIVSLLPAGSVSGAPKTKTLEIISEAEREKRGYYTGVCGLFDGVALDSAVMIRFIEQQGDQFFYRSGGGITTQSNPEKEYQEALDKIYVPLH